VYDKKHLTLKAKKSRIDLDIFVRTSTASQRLHGRAFYLPPKPSTTRSAKGFADGYVTEKSNNTGLTVIGPKRKERESVLPFFGMDAWHLHDRKKE